VRFLFAEFEFDSGRRLLLRHGRAAPLSTKGFQLLELLLDRRPEAVSKTEVLQHLWSETFVSDASLYNVVAEVRAALGDAPRAARFIRTVPRYGYAFHGDARPADTGVEAVQTARPGLRLVSKRGDWLLAEGSNLVGRERDCAVRIDSPSVSRHHARILVIQGEATVEDLGSKNGTYVNEEAVKTPVALKDRVEIRVGSVKMTYRIVAALPSTVTRRRL
jgi:DNA-binding winged helix-turn-helix (wHTH) protein